MADDKDKQDMTEIKVSLATIQRDLEHTSFRARNIETKLDAFVIHRDLEPLVARIVMVESFQTWVQRSIIFAVVAGLAGLILASKKVGL